jgi:hypothetical protein
MAIHTAKGTVLHFDSQGANFPPVGAPAIAQVRSITGPTVKPKIVDVTTHDTPGFWARKLTVLIEGGDISFEMNWDSADATHSFTSPTSLWMSMVGGINNSPPGLARASLQMIFPYSAGTMNFYGYVAQHEFTVPVDNVLAAKIQFAITDAITTSIP